MIKLLIWLWSNGSGESNFWVFNIKVSIEGFDEAVTDDKCLSQWWRKVKTHDSNDADCFSALLDLQDVVFSFQHIFVTTECEDELRELGDSVAVDLFLLSWSEASSHFIHNSAGANDDWCSSVNDTNKILTGLVAGSVEFNVSHIQKPVVVHFQRIILEASWSILSVDSTEN